VRRLFIGCALPESVRTGLTEFQDRLRADCTRQGVRFVVPAKFHVTLAFLGSVDDVSVIDPSARAICEDHAPFRLTTGELGGFPDLTRPRVLWAGIGGEVDSLRDLRSDIVAALPPGLVEETEFQPHITLARISPGSKIVGRAAAKLAESVAGVELGDWTVEEVTLFETLPDNSYAQVSSWPLTAKR